LSEGRLKKAMEFLRHLGWIRFDPDTKEITADTSRRTETGRLEEYLCEKNMFTSGLLKSSSSRRHFGQETLRVRFVDQAKLPEDQLTSALDTVDRPASAASSQAFLEITDMPETKSLEAWGSFISKILFTG